MDRSLPRKINRLAFAILILLFIFGYVSKDNYRQVDEIHPDLYQEPIQTEAINKTPILFERDGYHYEITPLYEYELNAFIVSRRDYRRFSLKRTDNLYPLDLCLLWGGNVKNKLYQSKKLSFQQDSRQSSWRWYGDLGFNNSQAANVHLVVENDSMQNRLDKLQVGDQIKITGQLVNVKAESLGDPGSYEPSEVQLNTSTTRSDAGPGACEIINVKSVEVLKKANLPANSLFKFGYFSLILLVISNIVVFMATTLMPSLDTDRTD